MIKPTKFYYYYAYKADDGLIISLPCIPTSSDLTSLKNLYVVYKKELSESLQAKKHIIIKVTTTYEQIEE